MIRMPSGKGGMNSMAGGRDEAVGSARSCARFRHAVGDVGLRWCGRREAAAAPNSVSVLMVNNPQMVDLQKLTADNFTKQTGITVNYTVLPENDVRDKISQEFSSQAGQYDVASLSNFEIPIYAKNGWLAPMDDFIAKDPAFDQADILKPMAESLTATDGKIYGEPFYGESSFLMYRKDVLQSKGITMPDEPDLAAGGRHRRQGRRGAAQHEGHLPARAARLGRGLRAADHGRQHLRRHLVRQGLEHASSTRRGSRTPPTSTSTWSGRTARTAPRRRASPSA